MPKEREWQWGREENWRSYYGMAASSSLKIWQYLTSGWRFNNGEEAL